MLDALEVLKEMEKESGKNMQILSGMIEEWNKSCKHLFHVKELILS